MSLENLVSEYGYLAIVVGTFFEGETILILGSIAAKVGYLKIGWVILFAFLGTLAGDQLFFYLGRYRGVAFLQKRPHWHSRVNRIEQLLLHHRLLIIFGFRFLYGLRTITPFVIGMTHISATEYLTLNICGAACWATLISLLSYAFGSALEMAVGDIRHYETEIVAAILLLGAAVGLFHIIRAIKQ